ncbi:MAG: hypothetical protein ABSA76_14830, partial [Bacteroidales bacterium]
CFMRVTESLESQKKRVKSCFFEFLKMRYLLDKSYGIYLGRNYYVPLQQIQDYINSLLLIDLFSVWEMAVDFIFESKDIQKPKNSKNKMSILKEQNILLQADYISWYTDWRNNIAHRTKRVEYYILNQAVKDIRKQLIEWDLYIDLPFCQYTNNESEKIFKTGVKIKDIIILEYFIKFEDQSGGMSTGWSETINLSFEDYLKSAKFNKHSTT